MPAAMMSNRLACRPGISDPNSVRTPSTSSIPMRLSTTRAISTDSPVTRASLLSI
ncbi:Uncharacterised protein [Bordetella pertussis]|nr:Uncharacterised protein [Bordetella pertussis]